LEIATVLETLPAITPRLDGLCPHPPSRRQAVFLGLESLEAFYGGAAGGGKTDALLMAASQYSHVPGYHAIIFRRIRPNLQAVIDRSIEWWDDIADWKEKYLRWVFPSGAMISFGHMQYERNKYDYKGFEYQFIGFDELTEFLETQYVYMFSRLRRPACNEHKSKPDFSCQICQQTMLISGVPLRFRAGSNPDGVGRRHVRQRFVSDQAAQEIISGDFADVYWQEDGTNDPIPFVPALVEDNPGLDVESYVEQSLSKLSPVVQAQLRRGDWRVS